MEEQNKKPKTKNSKEYNLAYYHEVIKAKDRYYALIVRMNICATVA